MILPRRSGHRFLLEDVTRAKSVTLLGSATPLKFKSSRSGTLIELPDLPGDLRQPGLGIAR